MACPMWVPIVEYGEYNSEGADFFVKKYLDQLMQDAPQTDTVLLACTHYPLLMDKIKKHLPAGINVIAQGDIVANSLADYLQRHPEMESRLSTGSKMKFYTTDDVKDFDSHASVFFGRAVSSEHLHL
eukprot:Opistho-2@2498